MLVRRPEHVPASADNGARIGDTAMQHLLVPIHDESLARDEKDR